MEREPVAWRAMEQGWRVVSSDGVSVGWLDQVTGDREADIFDGITVGDGGTVLTRAKYVPAEQVAQIWRGEIVLSVSAEEVRSLETYRPPVSQPLTELARDDEEPPSPGRPGFFSRVFRGGGF